MKIARGDEFHKRDFLSSSIHDISSHDEYVTTTDIFLLPFHDLASPGPVARWPAINQSFGHQTTMCVLLLFEGFSLSVIPDHWIFLPNSVFFLQVMEVIRENYGSLTLRLLDNLDYYEKYSEKPHEKAFFTQLVCE